MGVTRYRLPDEALRGEALPDKAAIRRGKPCDKPGTMGPGQPKLAQSGPGDIAQSLSKLQHALELVQRALRDLQVPSELPRPGLSCTLGDVQGDAVRGAPPLRAKRERLITRECRDGVTRQDRESLRLLPCDEFPEVTHLENVGRNVGRASSFSRRSTPLFRGAVPGNASSGTGNALLA